MLSSDQKQSRKTVSYLCGASISTEIEAACLEAFAVKKPKPNPFENSPEMQASTMISIEPL